jgi:hypothetical protein
MEVANTIHPVSLVESPSQRCHIQSLLLKQMREN